MKEQPAPDEIEIEVLSDVDAEAVTDRADANGPAGDGPSGRRLVVTTAIVGVIALVLGWLIGSSSGSDEAATTGTTTTPETTEAVEAELPTETMPLPPTTTTPRTTTTTTLAPLEVQTVEIDPRLVGIEQRLVGLERDGTHVVIVELDLARQILTRSDLGRFVNVEAMIAGDDWVVFVDQGGNAHLARDGEPVEQTLLRDAWELRWQVGTDRFWHPDFGEDGWGWGGPTVWEEIDITGAPTGVTQEIPLGTWAESVDPRGGLVIEVAGKHYSVDGSDNSLIGSGQLIGLSADTAVLWDCDDQLQCGLVVADRTTGTVRQLETGTLGDTLPPMEALWGYGGVTVEMISPDDGMCAATLMEYDGPRLVLIDLQSGSIVELATMAWPTPAFAWSPDARFAFFLDPGDGFGDDGFELRAYDRDSGETFPVFTEPRAWRALAARPVAPDSDGPSPLVWEIDVDDSGSGHIVRMIFDFGPMPDADIEDTSGRLIWDETEVALCSIAPRNEAPAGRLAVGDIFQTLEGCGDDPTAMQDAFDEFGLPESACVSVRTDGVDRTFCAPLTVIGG